MNKESFIQVLRNPKSISADQLAQVEEVVEQFPYFQIARSVIACGSKSLSKEDAQAKLAKAAIYTTNRQLLKKYVSGQFDFDVADSIQIGIHRETQRKDISADGETESGSTKKRAKFRIIERRSAHDETTGGSGRFVDLTKKQEEEDIDEELTIIDSKGVEKTTVTHTSIQTAKEQAEKEASDIKEKEQQFATPVVEEDSTQAEEVEEEVAEESVAPAPNIVAEIEEEETVTPKVEEPKLRSGELVDDVLRNLEKYRQSRDHYLEVEQKILNMQESDAINDAIEKANTKIKSKDDKPEETPKVKEKANPEKPAASKSKPAKSSKKEAAKKSTSTTAKTSTKQKKEEPKEEKSSKPKEDPSIEMVPEKVDNNIIDKEQSDSTISNTNPVDKKEAQKEIIERFIKTNPKILPSDEEPKGEISDLSTASAEMNDDLATENLAVILARQGKRDKAIEIYEKLILKIPKKKSYFAARIAELK
ncbi:MAG: hypothetical protein RIC80_23055 [Cyclobacteriaceae bacterium]